MDASTVKHSITTGNRLFFREKATLFPGTLTNPFPERRSLLSKNCRACVSGRVVTPGLGQPPVFMILTAVSLWVCHDSLSSSDACGTVHFTHSYFKPNDGCCRQVADCFVVANSHQYSVGREEQSDQWYSPSSEQHSSHCCVHRTSCNC